MNDKNAIIILAAGFGKRMKSKKAKVLHKIFEKPMINYVVETAKKIIDENIIVVVGYQADEVKKEVSKVHKVNFVIQQEPLGTGHAVLTALPIIDSKIENVVILCGDVPLVKVDTIEMLINNHIIGKHDITILGVELEKPLGYGRIIQNNNNFVVGIVEEKDATKKQKEINKVNSGIYCLKKEVLNELIHKITTNNAQNEFYLTDIVGLGYEKGYCIGLNICKDSIEVKGVNSVSELESIEEYLKNYCLKT